MTVILLLGLKRFFLSQKFALFENWVEKKLYFRNGNKPTNFYYTQDQTSNVSALLELK